MTLGPVEYALIAFPGNRFYGDVVPALSDLVEREVVHIVGTMARTAVIAGTATGVAGATRIPAS